MTEEEIQDSIKKFVAQELHKLRLGLKIPVALSNRHVHLSKDDFKALFGANAEPHVLRQLSQPGQHVFVETVDLCGPKRCIQGVRILGPFRTQTQVEISITDTYSLGYDYGEVPVRQSGNLTNSPTIELRSPMNSVKLKEGVICAARHIHMSPDDAKTYSVVDNQLVSVYFVSRRAGILDDVICRVNPNFRLEMHIDIDEGNALGVKNGDFGYLLPDIETRKYMP